MTDYPDWQTPQAHANALNTTGVPVLRNIATVRNTGPINPGVTSSVVHATFSSFCEGYLVELIPVNPGTKIFACDLVITHIDDTANTLAVEQVTLSNWQNVGNNTSVVRGRLLGVEIGVQVQVALSSWINTVTGSVVSADSVNLRICGLQTYVPGTGKRVPVITQSDGLLASGNPVTPLGTVANVVTLQQVMADYTGAVQLTSSTLTGGGLIYSGQIDSYTVSGGTSPVSTYRTPQINSTTPLNQQFALPSCFNIVRLVQNSTVSASAGMAVTVLAADQ